MCDTHTCECTNCCVILSYIQLSSTKSADQKTTLIHFLANIVELKNPHLLDFVLELRNVEEASKCEFGAGILVLFNLCLCTNVGSDEIIMKQLRQMESGLNKIKTELKNLKNPQGSEDKFFARMEVIDQCTDIHVYVYYTTYSVVTCCVGCVCVCARMLLLCADVCVLVSSDTKYMYIRIYMYMYMYGS